MSQGGREAIEGEADRVDKIARITTLERSGVGGYIHDLRTYASSRARESPKFRHGGLADWTTGRLLFRSFLLIETVAEKLPRDAEPAGRSRDVVIGLLQRQHDQVGDGGID